MQSLAVRRQRRLCGAAKDGLVHFSAANTGHHTRLIFSRDKGAWLPRSSRARGGIARKGASVRTVDSWMIWKITGAASGTDLSNRADDVV